MTPYLCKHERRATAHHEASHAITAATLNLPLKFVSIVPGSTTNGRCGLEMPISQLGVPPWRAIVWALAGAAGERRFRGEGMLPKSSSGFDVDYRIARALIDLSKGQQDARTLETAYEMVAVETVRRHWTWIARCAAALLVHQRLMAEDVIALQTDPDEGTR